MIDVSIVIPTKDRADYLNRAIESVARQSVKNIELIIVDDGSKDRTKELVFECKKKYNFPIAYIKNEKSFGGAKARNQGAKMATGKYLAFLDSDDEWERDHLKLGIGEIVSQNVDGIYGNYNTINENMNTNRRLKQKPEHLNFTEYILSGKGDTRTSTFIFKNIAFNKVKFDNLQAKHQDWDLAIRFSENYKLGFNVNNTVFLYEDIKNRMSYKMNHQATKYLLEKHGKNMSEEISARFYYLIAKDTLLIEGKNQYFLRYRRLSVNNYCKAFNFNMLIKDLKLFTFISLLFLPKRLFLTIYNIRYAKRN
ncbi:glycosyltransferase family 2 protein [Peribacillus simplex]|uniref:glycosyltransferase family 2 protein n=1 Tax=Peribacillus simplex TaxID=1478 RepID=UPI00366B0A4F